MEYKFNEVEINTKDKTIKINGKDVTGGVSHIKFDWEGKKEKAEVTIVMDAYVTLEGETILKKDMFVVNKKELK
jgi:predicted aspartyl protease